MNQDEVKWVREAFTSGSAAKLRLVTDHTIYDCGEAAGISGAAWWKFENGQSITTHRAESASPRCFVVCATASVSRRAPAPKRSERPLRPKTRRSRGARHKLALLVSAENLMNLSSAELVKAAPTWESAIVRETRAAARRVLHKRIFELGGEPPRESVMTGRG